MYFKLEPMQSNWDGLSGKTIDYCNICQKLRHLLQYFPITLWQLPKYMPQIMTSATVNATIYSS